MSSCFDKLTLFSALAAMSFAAAAVPAQAAQTAGEGVADSSMRAAQHRRSHPDIPNPNDVDVTRENLRRIINALLDAGLNRQQIKRWLYAALDNDPNIPNPGDVTVTRENIRRIINALKDAGLNRQQIKRWINASLDQQTNRRRYHGAARRRAASADARVRPARDAGAQRADRADRANRPTRVERPARPARPARPTRPTRIERPARPERPSRPGGGS